MTRVTESDYYRCHARCKRYPAIKEQVLNETVIQAIEEVVRNPQLILEQMSELDRRERQRAKLEWTERHQIEAEARQVQTEEERLLEAYRTGIISPAQLGQELEKLKARKSALNVRRAALVQNSSFQPEQIEKSVRDYCGEAAERMRSFSQESWREFLRIVVRKITFEGSHVRIQGEIPTATQTKSSRPEDPPPIPSLPSVGRIATMTIRLRDRNPGGEIRYGHANNVNAIQSVPRSFELTSLLQRSDRQHRC